MAVEGTTVKYYKNGTLVYTSAAAVTSAAGRSTPAWRAIGATVQNLTPATTATPLPAPAPAPPRVGGRLDLAREDRGVGRDAAEDLAAAATASTPARSASSRLARGGSVAFTVSAGQRQIVGLGQDTSASTSYAIDYAFSFWTGGSWEIRENNIYRTEGSYTATDVFKVAVDARAS